MSVQLLSQLSAQLEDLKQQGLYKTERLITSPQQAEVRVGDAQVINLCANNYLGLANHPRLIEAAREGVTRYGYGMASVRFICGTQDLHKTLEDRISRFLGTEDTLLYASAFDANGGLFETILGPEDAVISDALNHASIIDGIRLSKAKRYRYANSDMADLEAQLTQAKADGARHILIATDGVFSMDGYIAKLPEICDLAERFGALVMVDDCHATGFVGEKGGGSPELCGVQGRVQILTGTLGKALGGAMGGYTSGPKPIIEWLRQRSRPYLFSNALAPMIVAAGIEALNMLEESDDLRQRLRDNARHFRAGMTAAGFDLLPGEHPIIPVMLGDAKVASEMADALLAEGVYVVGFSFPVVPMGQARIRTQMSAAHTTEQLDRAIAAFTRVGRRMGVIPA